VTDGTDGQLQDLDADLTPAKGATSIEIPCWPPQLSKKLGGVAEPSPRTAGGVILNLQNQPFGTSNVLTNLSG
jgi:hypothetical protein